jgi:hypothetical protein
LNYKDVKKKLMNLSIFELNHQFIISAESVVSPSQFALKKVFQISMTGQPKHQFANNFRPFKSSP